MPCRESAHEQDRRGLPARAAQLFRDPPLAYVFIVIFLILAAVFTFQVGGFFERGQADLQPFFRWHPWLYLVLIPAISMRLWAKSATAAASNCS